MLKLSRYPLEVPVANTHRFMLAYSKISKLLIVGFNEIEKVCLVTAKVSTALSAVNEYTVL